MRRPTPFTSLPVLLGTRHACVAIVLPIAAVAGWLGWVAPDEIEQTVALTLFAQMFAAATGYRERACRGHFDQVLAFGASRQEVAAVHWLLSLAPGAVAWLLVAAVVSILRPTVWPSPLTPAGIMAFLYVSSAAWACALPLTRYASGVVWIVVLFVLAGAGQLGALREAFTTAATGSASVFTKAGAALVCPFFLMSDPQAAGAAALGLVLASTTLIVMCGVRFIVHLDLPLREPS